MNKFLDRAGKYKALSYLSCILAGLSALIIIISFWYIWKILICVILSEEKQNILHCGTLAFIFTLGSIVLYTIGLICSYKAALRITSSLRSDLNNNESFNEPLRIIMNYLAYNLPEKYAVMSLSLGLVLLLFYNHWLLALTAIAPLIFGFIVMAMISGSSMRMKLSEYHKAFISMSKDAAEYVRGSKSDKTFKTFAHSIEIYDTWSTAYVNELRLPMTAFTLAVNSSLLCLVLAGIFTGLKAGISREFMINFVLAVMTAPLISLSLMRIIRQNDNARIAADSLRKINEVLKGE
ncbi:MAG: ABC transporter ATP-binding protein [Synergistaceae bacterium]|nr:ABC transporter ATP-binding protein [Synergistaceae bacterium]